MSLKRQSVQSTLTLTSVQLSLCSELAVRRLPEVLREQRPTKLPSEG